jgi:hypothetical protein
VFWALTGAIYLTLGMPEVYRVLFEVFGMDIDGKTCQPQLRNIQDLDLLSPELDGRRLSWQEICFHQVSIPPSKNRKGLLLFMVCADCFGALLSSYVSSVPANIMTESSSQFWKHYRNPGHRFCIIICMKFWVDCYILLHTRCW